MAFATIYSRAQFGMQALLVSVEVHLSNGLPNFSIVGLPEAAVRESKDRVRAALINSNYEFPARRIIVNLAPAELPKQGGRFDLPIALGLLVASGQLPASALKGYEFIGELGLDGHLRKTTGILPAAHACQRNGCTLITSVENLEELTPLPDNSFSCATHLLDVCAHLNQVTSLPRLSTKKFNKRKQEQLSLSDVRGQHLAKRALCIAAAGQHHLLMIGSPGSGKTMLATRLPSLLTDLSQDQMLETMSVYSIANAMDKTLHPPSRPFRSPHHTVSAVGLVGGGSTPKPGEISLAHNGVLFMDEFTEFNRQALETLREPIEKGVITISRANAQVTFPARFQLIAAMNPCPAGCDIDQYGHCACSSEQLRRYRNKISAPILDRIDLQVSVAKVPYTEFFKKTTCPDKDWQLIKERIHKAYAAQLQRQGMPNALLDGKTLKEVCRLTASLEKLALERLQGLNLSARAYHKILKVARTIADIENTNDITQSHLLEAMSYRQFDRRLNK